VNAGVPGGEVGGEEEAGDDRDPGKLAPGPVDRLPGQQGDDEQEG